VIAAGALTLALVAQTNATAMYDYKPGQFLVVDGGTLPDKKFCIVAGESKSGDFGIYLIDAQTKKLIGQLEEVATGLDSAPDAFRGERRLPVAGQETQSLRDAGSVWRGGKIKAREGRIGCCLSCLV